MSCVEFGYGMAGTVGHGGVVRQDTVWQAWWAWCGELRRDMVWQARRVKAWCREVCCGLLGLGRQGAIS